MNHEKNRFRILEYLYNAYFTKYRSKRNFTIAKELGLDVHLVDGELGYLHHKKVVIFNLEDDGDQWYMLAREGIDVYEKSKKSARLSF